MIRLFTLCLIGVVCFLSGCHFHPQGEMHVSPRLHRLYLQTSDPYGQLARQLEQYFKMSHIEQVSTPQQATTVLAILKDANSQVLLGVSATQQTRQYNLITTVEFEVTDPAGRILIHPETLQESRIITIQSNQILGSSNEASMYYQQMRRTLAYAIMNRLTSQQITTELKKSAP